MDNLVSETNKRLQEIIDNLETIKNAYESKLEKNTKDIDEELVKVKKYKEDFFISKKTIEKMNDDIEGFEQDYQKLVERFKDDELANILIAANKEISSKIDERKRKIIQDKKAMNDLVEKAELVKEKLVKLTSEKKALELCLVSITDSYNYYTKTLSDIIEYASTHQDNLSEHLKSEKEYDEVTLENSISSKDVDSILNEINDNSFKEEKLSSNNENQTKKKDNKKDKNNKDEEQKKENSGKKIKNEDRIADELGIDFGEELDLVDIINFDDSLED